MTRKSGSNKGINIVFDILHVDETYKKSTVQILGACAEMVRIRKWCLLGRMVERREFSSVFNLFYVAEKFMKSTVYRIS